MSCNCISTVNKKLQGMLNNTASLDTTVVYAGDTEIHIPIITYTAIVDGDRVVLTSRDLKFCPFCGKEYINGNNAGKEEATV